MQTFLPYPSFAESAAALDTPRLGKQRVETLQVLRAILLPSYGWQSHPVTRMWRGHRAGLAAYGLATVAAWTERGHTDSTADLIAEFAPGLARLPQAELAERGLLPDWVDDVELHRSHRSNLIRKDPAYYGPLFPGVPADLDYVWPPPGEPEPLPDGRPLVIVRPRTAAEADDWRDEGVVALGDRSPAGRDTPKWRAQLTRFLDLPAGTEIATLVGNAPVLERAVITGDAVMRQQDDGSVRLVRPAAYSGELARGDFAVPAILQDPSSIFIAPLSAAR